MSMRAQFRTRKDVHPLQQLTLSWYATQLQSGCFWVFVTLPTQLNQDLANWIQTSQTKLVQSAHQVTQVKQSMAKKIVTTIKITKKSGDIYVKKKQKAIADSFSRTKQQLSQVASRLQRKKSSRSKKKHKSKQLQLLWKNVPPYWQQLLAPRAITSKKKTSRVTTTSSTWLNFKIATSAILSLALVLSFYWVYDTIFKDLPSAADVIAYQPSVSTQILDRNGQLLYQIYQDENRTVVPLAQISPFLQQATIAIEDQHFYTHPGFDVQGIFRAAVANASGQPIQGGSTLTQQLVKNTVLSNEKTLQRKVRELLVAILVDASLTKDQILELYLNQVAYGGTTYGVEQASQAYFAKSAQDLNLAESALLAGLPAAPSLYSPFGPFPERATQRQAEVLHRMVEEDFITQQQMDEVLQTQLQFSEDATAIQAPHFVFYIREILAEEFGEQALLQDGLIVTTSLDLELQRQAQQIVTQEIDSLQRLRITNGAALVTNPQTGEILSMVGSKNYFDFANDGQVNVTLRPRQPGSSIKPLTYALALEKGKTPQSIIADTPTVYRVAGSPPYSPKNYDGRFRGNVTLREALASSYNVPAVKLLAEIGVNTMIDKAEEMGVTTWGNRQRFGLALTLGGGEVTMTELAQVYGTFANQGKTITLNPILEVTNYQGEVLYQNPCVFEQKCLGEQTLTPGVASQITSILSDNVARTPAFGPRSVLNIPDQQVAVKTGTTNNLRDNWTNGYTSDRVVMVWVGNNDNTPMSYVASGITGASPIWNKIMRLLLSEDQPHRFEYASNLEAVEICATTGTLPCRGCPRVVTEYFVPGTQPTQACNSSYFAPKPTPIPDPNRDRILEGIQF